MRPRNLTRCTVCGCKSHGWCSRMVDMKDGSVYPLNDTGFRMPTKMGVRK